MRHALAVLVAVLLSGGVACASRIPVAELSPAIDYAPASPVIVSVIDARAALAQGRPNTFVGRIASGAGLQSDLHVHPFYLEDDAYRGLSLAAALEARVVGSLSAAGASASGLGTGARPSDSEVAALLRERGARQLLAITLHDWRVSTGGFSIAGFAFTWGASAEVVRLDAATVKWSGHGRDATNVPLDETAANHARTRFREALAAILGAPAVRSALASP